MLFLLLKEHCGLVGAMPWVNPFTLRRIHAGEWWGALEFTFWCLSCYLSYYGNPRNFWRFLLSSGKSWFSNSAPLAKWLESHPQREDLYASLRPLLVERPRQDRTFIDEIDQLQSSLRVAQISDSESLQVLKLPIPVSAGCFRH